jgi:transcriptional regulator with XRE-family HTH domain
MSSKLWDQKASEVSPKEFEAIEAEERLVYEAQKAVRNLLKRKALKAADLATLLGVSEARVSQMLAGNGTNLTLRSLARIFHKLGTRCVLSSEESDEAAAQHAPAVVADARQGTRPAKNKPASKASGDDNKLALWTTADLSLDDPHLLELADYGRSQVWALGDSMTPANENHRSRHSDERDHEARSWLSASLPAYEAAERIYA